MVFKYHLKINHIAMKTKCLVYISSKLIEADVNEFISKCRNDAVLEKIEMDKNDFFDLAREYEFPDGFLFFKHILEIHFKKELEIDIVVNFVNKVLQYLWDKNIPSVASCNYEDLLFNNGGYKSTKIPW